MPNCWHGKLLHVHRASLLLLSLLLSLLFLLLRLQVSLLLLLLLLEALVAVGVMWYMCLARGGA